MSKRIYVGNLPFTATSSAVRDLCARYGKVRSVRLGRGEATVEMESDTVALAAVKALGRPRLGGKTLEVRIR